MLLLMLLRPLSPPAFFMPLCTRIGWAAPPPAEAIVEVHGGSCALHCGAAFNVLVCYVGKLLLKCGLQYARLFDASVYVLGCIPPYCSPLSLVR